MSVEYFKEHNQPFQYQAVTKENAAFNGQICFWAALTVL